MSDILIRGLDPRVVKRLKARAKRHGRSLQGEAKLALERVAQEAEPKETAAMLARWKKEFAGRRFSGSAELIREDRER